MSIKIALLKSGESVISDIKELIQDEKICGYLFKNPYVVDISSDFTQEYLTETMEHESDEINVRFFPWIPLTKDTEIPVRYDWLVTVVSPANEIEKLYEEMLDDQNDQSNPSI
jgi:hypothetical protein